jgi:hypothetical protein
MNQDRACTQGQGTQFWLLEGEKNIHPPFYFSPWNISEAMSLCNYYYREHCVDSNKLFITNKFLSKLSYNACVPRPHHDSKVQTGWNTQILYTPIIGWWTCGSWFYKLALHDIKWTNNCFFFLASLHAVNTRIGHCWFFDMSPRLQLLYAT